jgi:Ca2+-binding RTX toxin-like protein
MGPAGRVVFTAPVQLTLRLGSGADDLTIDGTPSGAAITVFAGGGNDRVIGAGTTTPLDLPPVLGRPRRGSDRGTGPGATTPLTLYGEAGNDLLVGGSANDVLDGGVGDDVLIGRQGSDTLLGQDGDDLLIAGATAFDVDRTALLAVMAEWSRSDVDVATRVAHLRGQQAGGLNGPYTLTPATVTNDAVVNTLTGGNGINWFFCALGRDQLTDFEDWDFIN